MTVVVEGGTGVEEDGEGDDDGDGETEGDTLDPADGWAVAEAHPPAAHPTATTTAMARARTASSPLVLHPSSAYGWPFAPWRHGTSAETIARRAGTDDAFTAAAWIGAAVTALALGISFTLRPPARAAATAAP